MKRQVDRDFFKCSKCKENTTCSIGIRLARETVINDDDKPFSEKLINPFFLPINDWIPSFKYNEIPNTNNDITEFFNETLVRFITDNITHNSDNKIYLKDMYNIRNYRGGLTLDINSSDTNMIKGIEYLLNVRYVDIKIGAGSSIRRVDLRYNTSLRSIKLESEIDDKFMLVIPNIKDIPEKEIDEERKLDINIPNGSVSVLEFRSDRIIEEFIFNSTKYDYIYIPYTMFETTFPSRDQWESLVNVNTENDKPRVVRIGVPYQELPNGKYAFNLNNIYYGGYKHLSKELIDKNLITVGTYNEDANIIEFDRFDLIPDGTMLNEYLALIYIKDGDR